MSPKFLPGPGSMTRGGLGGSSGVDRYRRCSAEWKGYLQTQWGVEE